MGDPIKSKNKFKKPRHPWQAWRIEEERPIKKDYGLKNKTEIWKASSELRKLNSQAKNLIRQRNKEDAQAIKEEKQMLTKLFKLGLVNEDAKLEDVLALELKDLLDRRLQTIVFKSGMCMTPLQARQFIVHGSILVNGKKITVPSYKLSRDEEFKITFNPKSTISSDEHPERAKKNQQKANIEKKKVKESKDEEAPLGLTEEVLSKIEKEIGEVVAEK